jgi:hypothetical protein
VRTNIKGFLEGFIEGMVKKKRSESVVGPYELRPPRTSAPNADYRPFHESILPEGILRITEFERSFSTGLGKTFEEVARIIGAGHWHQAERGYSAKGAVSDDAVRTIEQICNGVSSDRLHQPWSQSIAEVIAASGDGNVRARIADLHLLGKDGEEVFFEIKSPKPNKGQCVEITDRLLQIHAMRRQGPPKVRTFYAMAYNPYGEDKAAYKHSFALGYLDFSNQVVIGREFWDLVGGKGTYEQLLEIYREVGKEKGPDMIDQLALNY